MSSQLIVCLRGMFESPEEEGGAQHQQDVRDYGSEKGALDNKEFVLTESNDAHDQLRDVSHGGVHEASDGVIGIVGEVFCDETEALSKWNES